MSAMCWDDTSYALCHMVQSGKGGRRRHSRLLFARVHTGRRARAASEHPSSEARATHWPYPLRLPLTSYSSHSPPPSSLPLPSPFHPSFALHPCCPADVLSAHLPLPALPAPAQGDLCPGAALLRGPAGRPRPKHPRQHDHLSRPDRRPAHLTSPYRSQRDRKQALLLRALPSAVPQTSHSRCRTRSRDVSRPHQRRTRTITLHKFTSSPSR